MPYNGKHDEGQINPSLTPVPLKNNRNKKKIILLILGFFFLTLLGGAGFIWSLVKDLPSIDGLKTYKPSASTRVYDENRVQIGHFAIERRTPVPLIRIPKYLFQAIIAVEERRLMEHGGFDLRRFFNDNIYI